MNSRACLIGVVAGSIFYCYHTWPTGEGKLGMVSAYIGLSSFCP